MGTKGLITDTMWRKNGDSFRAVFMENTNIDSLEITHHASFVRY